MATSASSSPTDSPIAGFKPTFMPVYFSFFVEEKSHNIILGNETWQNNHGSSRTASETNYRVLTCILLFPMRGWHHIRSATSWRFLGFLFDFLLKWIFHSAFLLMNFPCLCIVVSKKSIHRVIQKILEEFMPSTLAYKSNVLIRLPWLLNFE